MTAATHLCLGVDQCVDCDPLQFALIELRMKNTTGEDALLAVSRIVKEMPGVEVHRPIEAQQSFLDDAVEVCMVLRVTDRKLVPEERHGDPGEQSIPGGILESFFEQLSPAAGSSGWVRSDWGAT